MDASAKQRRSQRFGASLQDVQVPGGLGSSQGAAFGAHAFAPSREPSPIGRASPEPMGDDADAGPGMMDDDGALYTHHHLYLYVHWLGWELWSTATVIWAT